jgi:hypothetical protein
MSFLRAGGDKEGGHHRRNDSVGSDEGSPRTNRGDSFSKKIGTGLISILSKYNPAPVEKEGAVPKVRYSHDDMIYNLLDVFSSPYFFEREYLCNE